MNVDVVLPKPHKGQQQVLESQAKYRILCCGRRWGKSVVAKISVIKLMLEGKQTAYVTPTYSLGKLFYREIIELLPKLIIKSEHQTDLEIHLITGGSIKFFTGENLNAFRGRKFHFITIDEAAFIPDLEYAWNESIKPTLTDYYGDALFISTPRGKNFFYSLFIKGLNKEENFESFLYTSYDNPYLPATAIDEAKAVLPDASFKQEYLAEPSENANNPFSINAIKANTIKKLSNEPTVVYGIDLARTVDYTVIIGLDINGCMTYFDRFQKPWVQTKETIQALPDNILKVVDSTGVGEVLVEDMAMNTPNLIGFKFTTQSKPNLILELINAVEKGDVKYNEIVANELGTMEYKITSTGHIKYQAQSGFHDDTVMALALANKHKQQAVHQANWKLYRVR